MIKQIISALFVVFCVSGYQAKAQFSTKGLDVNRDIAPWFHDQAGVTNTPLVIGYYQEIGGFTKRHHPFFASGNWLKGQIKYRDRVFEGVFMRYHLEDDYLVILHPTNRLLGNQPIKLNQEQVAWFELEGHHYENYQQEGMPLGKGFYDELYIGENIHLLVKRKKRKDVDEKAFGVAYYDEGQYIIGDGDTYEKVKRRRYFIKRYPAHKKAIRKFTRKHHLTIRRGYDADWVQLVKFCDQLNQD